jgi:hypothetical protein
MSDIVEPISLSELQVARFGASSYADDVLLEIANASLDLNQHDEEANGLIENGERDLQQLAAVRRKLSAAIVKWKAALAKVRP